MGSFVIHVFFGEMSVKSFAHFLFGSLFSYQLFLLSTLGSLYIMDTFFFFYIWLIMLL